MNEFTVRLDLAKGKARQQQTIFVRQGDRNATTIVATITDHGAAAATSGLTARFQMRLPDGTHYYRKAASLSGNVATVALDEAQAASAVGRTDTAYFQLLQGSTVVASTESFSIVVLPDALADAEVAESYDSAIQDAIDALDAAVEQMPDMVEDVLTAHPEWTTTVQDGSITQAKLATNLARDRERLQYRLANMLTNALPEGETATASDAAKTPVAGLALYGRSTQDGTPTPSAPVPIVSVGTANLLDDGAPSEVTSRGITVTPESDGWFRISGTATGTNAGVTTIWGSSDLDLPAGTYTAVVETEGTPFVASMLRLQVYASSVLAYIIDAGTYPLNATTAITRIGLYFAAGSAGTVVDGRFRIALYAGSTACPYVPYGHAGLWARGKNLLGVKPVSGTMTGYYKEITPSSGDMYSQYELVAGQTYTVSMDVQSSVLPFKVSVGAGDLMYSRDIANVEYNASGRISITFTPNASSLSLGSFIMLRAPRFNTSTTVTYSVTNIMLERGSTAHAYEPYASTVTPIDLDGHELRSLPDGTRDELTVDERGHAVLVQRVGSVTLDGSEAWSLSGGGGYRVNVNSLVNLIRHPATTTEVLAVLSAYFVGTSDNATYAGTVGISCRTNGILGVTPTGQATTVADWTAWLAEHPLTVLYPLATPVTHDLGTVPLVPLVGPDLTAQMVPSAPFALTYERDLNATLARLESAIATLV